MAFAVGRVSGLGAPAQVRALADFSDPEALSGLSETDRQQIVNFTVPATSNTPTGIEGTVTRDGALSPSAPVAALDPTDGTVLAYGLSDASGHFVLRGLTAGEVRLLAVDPLTNRPGSAPATVIQGSLTTADIAAIPASDMGTVQGTVYNGSGEAVAGVPLTARVDTFAPLWKGEATSGPAGEYTLAAPPGTIGVRANDDPSTESLVTLDPGGTVVLDLTVP